MVLSTDSFWNKKGRRASEHTLCCHCWLSGWLPVCWSFYFPGSLFCREKNTRNQVTILLRIKILIRILNQQWPNEGRNLIGNNANSKNIAQPTLRASCSSQCTGFITQIDLSPKSLPCSRWRGSTIAAHLWEDLPRKSFGRHVKVPNSSLFTLPFVSAILYLCMYTESHICSGKSDSQVDDYAIFIYKEPSAFPTMIVTGAKLCKLWI